jgi:predicted unusual protein kinase regulating ubiquinone biosynthesis (AarF/ABC1/UbiB family)
MGDEKKIEKIRSSVFSRGLRLAKLTMNTGASLAGHGLGTLLSSPERKSEKWRDFLKGRASEFSTELGELKGSLMKAGQMLSMYGEHFLPPEANELLKSLQSQSPPLAWPAIEKVLRENFSSEQMQQLEIDPVAVGSASLGQVHTARIKATGEVIALKIQYPGVDKAIDSDLRALRSFLNMIQVLPRGVATDHIFAEVRAMLVQEMDYALEARQTEEYGERLKGDSRFVVPRVYREFSNAKILATSFERGVSPDDPLVLALSQERRNRLALNFLDLYFAELFEWGVVQTDPHLGNYRVRLSPDGNDRLILLDFGAVRRYSEDFLHPYHRMIKAALDNDMEALSRAALTLRFLHEGDDPNLVKYFEDFCVGTIEPFMPPEDPRNTRGQINERGEYDWKNSDLPRRLTRLVFEMIQKFHVRPPPREILFLDRKTGGVFIFLSVLGAKICARPLLVQRLQNIRTDSIHPHDAL